MHFEFLVEDRSGYEMIEYLIPKIIGTNSGSINISMGSPS